MVFFLIKALFDVKSTLYCRPYVCGKSNQGIKMKLYLVFLITHMDRSFFTNIAVVCISVWRFFCRFLSLHQTFNILSVQIGKWSAHRLRDGSHRCETDGKHTKNRYHKNLKGKTKYKYAYKYEQSDRHTRVPNAR